MKRFITTLALALALSGSVLAGDIPTSGSPAPAPNAPTTAAAPGDLPSQGKAEFSTEALSGLLSVLSFLV